MHTILEKTRRTHHGRGHIDRVLRVSVLGDDRRDVGDGRRIECRQRQSLPFDCIRREDPATAGRRDDPDAHARVLRLVQSCSGGDEESRVEQVVDGDHPSDTGARETRIHDVVPGGQSPGMRGGGPGAGFASSCLHRNGRYLGRGRRESRKVAHGLQVQQQSLNPGILRQNGRDLLGRDVCFVAGRDRGSDGNVALQPEA